MNVANFLGLATLNRRKDWWIDIVVLMYLMMLITSGASAFRSRYCKYWVEFLMTNWTNDFYCFTLSFSLALLVALVQGRWRNLSILTVWLNTSPAAPASPAPLSTSPASDVCKCYIGPSVASLAWLSVLSSARPPPTLLFSGMLIGGGGYMTAPSPLVPGRCPVTSFC